MISQLTDIALFYLYSYNNLINIGENMYFAIIIILAGIGWLLQNLGIINGNFWGIFWPLLIIFWGISMLIRRRSDGCYWSYLEGKTREKK